ncbi:unnamed protein product [Heterobilharzia americana]|nr:unnamed protein product [Heterobilharzia americana]CAH8535888.1 unnamed protein product [Heterobilharzia americana]
MNFDWKIKNQHTAKYHTDTVEFCPDGSMVLCGSYELNSVSQERLGGVLLFSRVSNDQYNLSCIVPCPGVLDTSWISESVSIGALANGSTKLWNCTDHSSIIELIDFQVSDHILLSVDACSDRFVFSDSGGNISLWKIDVSSSSHPQAIAKWCGHEFEAWCACLSKWHNDLVFTGSDDSKCCVWDLRQGCKKPLTTIRQNMGVCSIRYHPDLEYLFSTGSYDETLCIWDLRMVNSIKELSNPIFKCHFNGGVWRHKWGPHSFVIVAAMHAGFAVTHLSQSSFNSIEKNPIYKFRPTDEQLAYGIDWTFESYHSGDLLKPMVVSCSFYDNSIEFGELTINLNQ